MVQAENQPGNSARHPPQQPVVSGSLPADDVNGKAAGSALPPASTFSDTKSLRREATKAVKDAVLRELKQQGRPPVINVRPNVSLDSNHI